VPGGEAGLLSDPCTQLLLRAALFHALRCVGWFPTEALLVCAVLHLLRIEVETFEKPSERFSITSSPAELLRDAATLPKLQRTSGTLPRDDEGLHRHTLIQPPILFLQLLTKRSNHWILTPFLRRCHSLGRGKSAP